jgi:DNA-binding response OmpR family regulator
MINNYNILVVEDSLTTLLLIEWHLKEQGYLTIRAANAAEALIQTENQAPNLIVLDLQLPDILGFDFLKMLKFDREKMNVPVLIISKSDSKEMIRKALMLGADGFMPKPLNMKILCEKIDKLLKFEVLKQGTYVNSI